MLNAFFKLSGTILVPSFLYIVSTGNICAGELTKECNEPVSPYGSPPPHSSFLTEEVSVKEGKRKREGDLDDLEDEGSRKEPKLNSVEEIKSIDDILNCLSPYVPEIRNQEQQLETKKIPSKEIITVDDVWQIVFGFLDPADVGSVRRVSRLFNRLASTSPVTLPRGAKLKDLLLSIDLLDENGNLTTTAYTLARQISCTLDADKSLTEILNLYLTEADASHHFFTMETRTGFKTCVETDYYKKLVERYVELTRDLATGTLDKLDSEKKQVELQTLQDTMGSQIPLTRPYARAFTFMTLLQPSIYGNRLASEKYPLPASTPLPYCPLFSLRGFALNFLSRDVSEVAYKIIKCTSSLERLAESIRRYEIAKNIYKRNYSDARATRGMFEVELGSLRGFSICYPAAATSEAYLKELIKRGSSLSAFIEDTVSLVSVYRNFENRLRKEALTHQHAETKVKGGHVLSSLVDLKWKLEETHSSLRKSTDSFITSKARPLVPVRIWQEGCHLYDDILKDRGERATLQEVLVAAGFHACWAIQEIPLGKEFSPKVAKHFGIAAELFERALNTFPEHLPDVGDLNNMFRFCCSQAVSYSKDSSQEEEILKAIVKPLTNRIEDNLVGKILDYGVHVGDIYCSLLASIYERLAELSGTPEHFEAEFYYENKAKEKRSGAVDPVSYFLKRVKLYRRVAMWDAGKGQNKKYLETLSESFEKDLESLSQNFIEKSKKGEPIRNLDLVCMANSYKKVAKICKEPLKKLKYLELAVKYYEQVGDRDESYVDACKDGYPDSLGFELNSYHDAAFAYVMIGDLSSDKDLKVQFYRAAVRQLKKHLKDVSEDGRPTINRLITLYAWAGRLDTKPLETLEEIFEKPITDSDRLEQLLTSAYIHFHNKNTVAAEEFLSKLGEIANNSEDLEISSSRIFHAKFVVDELKNGVELLKDERFLRSPWK